MRKFAYVLLAALGFSSLPVQADVDGAKQFVKQYAALVKGVDSSYVLNAEAGRAFYTKKHDVSGKSMACTDCHTDNPAAQGKHAKTGKPIASLSPSVNPKRFSNLKKTEELFDEHCVDVLSRNCTSKEKGDYITYLLSIK
ncbi:MAG: DUF1924 domain-containing protein [Gallionella sp.]|nr:DUF1924 domain-containing protein [Gallionella sp.]